MAVALTYVRNTGSPIYEDLPWAGMVSDDTGGVTCICISGKLLSVEWRSAERICMDANDDDLIFQNKTVVWQRGEMPSCLGFLIVASANLPNKD